MINCIINKSAYNIKKSPNAKPKEALSPISKLVSSYTKKSTTSQSKSTLMLPSQTHRNEVRKGKNRSQNKLTPSKPNTFHQTKNEIFQKDLIKLIISYKSAKCELNLDIDDNGFSIANSINVRFGLKLTKNEVDSVAVEIARQINNYIKLFTNNPKHIPNFGIVIDLADIINRSKVYKIAMKFGKVEFVFYIHDSEDEVSDVVNDILKIVNSDDKYDGALLRKQIEKAVKESIKNANRPQ